MSTPPVSADKVDTAAAVAPHQPYIPASQNPVEMTIRALLLGSILGIVFAASSVYLAVRVGMTVSASIPIAVLSIAIFRAFGKSKSSILENTIVQTTGSAGESLAFGVAAALPALLLMGYDIDFLHALLVAGLGGVLGVLMMIPLRYGLIVQEHGKLMYPEGTACADVLIVGEQGGTNARTVVVGFLVGAAYKFGYAGLRLWREVIDANLWTDIKLAAGKILHKGYYGAQVQAEISPELLGVGYIIGPKVAGITFAGGVLSYLVLIPAIKFFGDGFNEPFLTQTGLTIRDMSPDHVRSAYVLYIGAGAVATGGLISLLRSLPTIVNAFKRGMQTFMASRQRGDAAGPELPRTEQDLPITVVLIGSLLLVLLIWLIPTLHVNFVSAMLIIVFGFFFVTVSARITGEIGSSSNPISGMVVATLLITCLLFLLFGWTSAQDRFMALTTAAIVGIAASNGGTTAQDLKTAHLVGGTPRRQQIALFVGVLTSAAVIGLTLITLNDAYTSVIPEPHPGVKTTHAGEKTYTQQRFKFALDEAKLTEQGYALKDLSGTAWASGFELKKLDQGYALLTFGGGALAEINKLQLRGDNKPTVPVTAFGTASEWDQIVWKTGYVRGDSDQLQTGKYLVDERGDAMYVVDPAIGGRVTEYQGHKLTRFVAPKAQLFSLIIDGILTQKLPWSLVLIGVFIALMLELCGVSALPFAVGVYLPIATSAPIFFGGMIRWLVDRIRNRGKAENAAETEFSPGVLLASGYIAGGAIAGTLLAFLRIPAEGKFADALNLPARTGQENGLGRLLNLLGESEHHDPIWSALFGFAVFGVLCALLYRTGTKGQSGASATHTSPPPAK